jgi:L-threonylcarbamoyladenylate synthase
VPDHVVALALLEAFERAGGKGMAAPSANRFGHVSPTTANAVIEELGDFLSNEDLVLDGGACVVGVESTIIDCTGAAPSVLRPGAISVAMIEECTRLKTTGSDREIRVSGSLENHYAPVAKVVLDQIPIPGQGFIALASEITSEGVIRLATPSTNEEFAQVLYSSFRAADKQKLEIVVVAQPVGDGIALAIRDRLARAAFKK